MGAPRRVNPCRFSAGLGYCGLSAMVLQCYIDLPCTSCLPSVSCTGASAIARRGRMSSHRKAEHDSRTTAGTKRDKTTTAPKKLRLPSPFPLADPARAHAQYAARDPCLRTRVGTHEGTRERPSIAWALLVPPLMTFNPLNYH